MGYGCRVEGTCRASKICSVAFENDGSQRSDQMIQILASGLDLHEVILRALYPLAYKPRRCNSAGLDICEYHDPNIKRPCFRDCDLGQGL